MLYGTTNDFLELLNLQSLKDLPTLREYTELSEESQRKFMEETGEEAPSGAALDGAGLDEARAHDTTTPLDPSHAGEIAGAATRATGEAEGEHLDALQGDAELDAGAQPEASSSRHPRSDSDSSADLDEDEASDRDEAEASASTAAETSAEHDAEDDAVEHDRVAESGELTDETSDAPDRLRSDENDEDPDTETAEAASGDAAPDSARAEDEI
jgi:segregation and condensation protein B